jgi:hypothetical protein
MRRKHSHHLCVRWAFQNKQPSVAIVRTIKHAFITSNQNPSPQLTRSQRDRRWPGLVLDQ